MRAVRTDPELSAMSDGDGIDERETVASAGAGLLGLPKPFGGVGKELGWHPRSLVVHREQCDVAERAARPGGPHGCDAATVADCVADQVARQNCDRCSAA
jgi:hypothetical protein